MGICARRCSLRRADPHARRLFLAGIDWRALAPAARERSPVPMVNLIQGFRHTAARRRPPAEFLRDRAIRICVSPELAAGAERHRRRVAGRSSPCRSGSTSSACRRPRPGASATSTASCSPSRTRRSAGASPSACRRADIASLLVDRPVRETSCCGDGASAGQRCTCRRCSRAPTCRRSRAWRSARSWSARTASATARSAATATPAWCPSAASGALAAATLLGRTPASRAPLPRARAGRSGARARQERRALRSSWTASVERWLAEPRAATAEHGLGS